MINILVLEPLDRLEGSLFVDRTSNSKEHIHHFEAIMEQAARATLEHIGAASEVELTLVLASDDRLHQLNRDFLGVDSSTDVLAFPDGEMDPDSGSTNLGDVIISYRRAQDQATVSKHPIEEELQLLVVHGVLHLSGYDHDCEVGKNAMWRLQEEILIGLNDTVSDSIAQESD